jgi:alpha-methylacyl-CoA racemase
VKVLEGVRVLELGAIGPVPWAGMLLADMGADIVRIDRPGPPAQPAPTTRGRTVVQLDLKSQDGQRAALDLAASADVLLEGMRPGALERLGLAPEACWQRNPALVIGRMTGWGQSGPLAARAGHDINYIALTGVLHSIGREKPTPPLNLVGDYGGGGAFLLIGVLSAVLAARSTGKGRVVDAAMVDGAASMMTLAYERLMLGRWRDERGVNGLDGGVPWYDVYETRDARWMAVGCNEPEFYRIFVETLGLDPTQVPDRNDRANWPALRSLFAKRFAELTRDEWTAIFEPTDACVTPVLSMLEAPRHPHNAARATFREFAGHVVPGPAPRFDAGLGDVSGPSVATSAEAALARWRRDQPQ